MMAIQVTFHYWLRHLKCSIGSDVALSPFGSSAPFYSPLHAAPRQSRSFFVLWNLHTHIGRSFHHVCFFLALGLSILSIPLAIVGGETSWLGTSRLQCLCDARVVLWFLLLGKFSSNVNPLVLCSITSCLRPSALVFHITKWQLASIQDTCKDSSGMPPIIWFHLEYSCHVVSSFCVFVYTNHVSFRLFKQQPIVY
jgi:hypothetical protein